MPHISHKFHKVEFVLSIRAYVTKMRWFSFSSKTRESINPNNCTTNKVINRKNPGLSYQTRKDMNNLKRSICFIFKASSTSKILQK